ncbi:mucin-associated surface protein (MASP), putative, partial [Trypanosoma cruzi]
RVLLVCVLCVLWCGAGGGECSETTQEPSGTTPDEEPQKEKEVVGGAGEGVQSGQKTASQAAAPTISELPEGVPCPSQATQPGEASEKEDAAMDNQDRNAQEYKKEEKKEEKAEDEEEDDDKKEKGDTRKEEAVTSTTEGITAGGQEQPIISSGAEGASNITNPNSTPTTGDDAPAADAAGTAEGKQNENKDANPKERPVEATATKITTATTGDSDGSTAVSHTTSPLLLLLLVVACAAAAAVVAA